MSTSWSPEEIREHIVGIDALVQTPFGERRLLYCDYTASGRCLTFVEDYLQNLQRWYANSHTEDDITGQMVTRLIHEAEASIKSALNVGPNGSIVACGAGATAAIEKLQQIVGVSLGATTKDRLVRAGVLSEDVERKKPVVFVGPYEHHSNEVLWRHAWVDVVRVDLDIRGQLDLSQLEDLLQRPEYVDRPKIGSFSAASNVTGVKTDVYATAVLLHRYGALACFDYAAAAPYVTIDMNPKVQQPGDQPHIDALYISTHKFLGGPGSCGILAFSNNIYRTDLAPTVCGGGTVAYVGLSGEDFITDIEEREKAGTPGILQIWKAGLAFQLKERVGATVIAEREHRYTEKALRLLGEHPRVEVLGPLEPMMRIGIVSFNLLTESGERIHHRLVSRLLNDLFGIQSRAGCSCAGPYGHALLSIDDETSEAYREAIVNGEFHALKPGWCRIGLHWVLDEFEIDFILSAICFLAEEAELFVSEYQLDLATGAWNHRDEPGVVAHLCIEEALARQWPKTAEPLSAGVRRQYYRRFLEVARAEADSRRAPLSEGQKTFSGVYEKLRYFPVSSIVESGRQD